MNNITLYIETFSLSHSNASLAIISLLSILFAILVITSKNPVVSVLFLIGLFMTIALHLILLGISYVGLSYILVYVGAVSILFLFILMLINVRVSELVTDSTNSIPLVLIIAVFFSYCTQKILPVYSLNVGINSMTGILSQSRGVFMLGYFSSSIHYYAQKVANEVYFVTSMFWDGNLAEITHITSIGNIMYTNYSI